MHESEKWKGSNSVVSDSSRPHGLQPTRLLRPWDFPGKSTGVGAIAFSIRIPTPSERCLFHCFCYHSPSSFFLFKTLLYNFQNPVQWLPPSSICSSWPSFPEKFMVPLLVFKPWLDSLSPLPSPQPLHSNHSQSFFSLSFCLPAEHLTHCSCPISEKNFRISMNK